MYFDKPNEMAAWLCECSEAAEEPIVNTTQESKEDEVHEEVKLPIDVQGTLTLEAKELVQALKAVQNNDRSKDKEDEEEN